MRLGKLKIERYKNLKELDINFSKSNVSVLMGTNGSGKSNIIEVLSKVFRDQYFDQSREVPIPNKQIEYECNYVVNSIESVASQYFVGKKTDEDGNIKSIFGSTFTQMNSLPNKVICVYSGEEKRLWEEFFEEFYLDYIKCVKKKSLVNPKMIYVNKYHWSISLLLLAIYMPEVYNKLNFPPINSVVFKFADKDISNYETNEVVLLLQKLEYEKEKEKKFNFQNLKEGFIKDYPNKEEIFNFLVLATLPKEDKLIENINIIFDNNVNIKGLSEGEKKLVVLNAVYELLADNETLVLLDEPDTYVHEGRKKEIHKLVTKYADIGVCTVMTSHSPTMTKLFNEEQIIMLTMENGCTKQIPTNKIKAVQDLTNNEWTLTDTNTLLSSDKILILVEGKSDIKYINKAIELLREDLGENYEKLQFDMLSFGGTGNCVEFYEQTREIVGNNRKIICIVDRDESGSDALRKLIDFFSVANISTSRETFDYYVFQPQNTVLMMYPNKDKAKFPIDFVIEDYFPRREIEESLGDTLKEFQEGSSSKLPGQKCNVKENVKNNIAKRSINYDKAKFQDFIILLNKIIEIIDQL